jgi:hypothetical protein
MRNIGQYVEEMGKFNKFKRLKIHIILKFSTSSSSYIKYALE